jgi:hypothetical protein
MLEALRPRCGELMELGDVTSRNYPKMGLIAAPTAGGGLATRSYSRTCATTRSAYVASGLPCCRVWDQLARQLGGLMGGSRQGE